MRKIGLVAAMAQESKALLHQLTTWDRISLSHFQASRFELSGQQCVLITSGMGMQRAAAATRELMNDFSPHLLISFGIAGAVDAELQVGDVVLAESVCQFDRGVVSPLIPLSHWMDAAYKAISHIVSEQGHRVYTGTAVTTNGSQATQVQLGDLLHPILEMETAGIAREAVEKGIPLLSLRAISDGPSAPLPFVLGEVMDEHANLRTGGLLRLILRHPGIIFQSLRMRRNSRIAEESAASSLLAAISRGNF
jgi:adenosylhomocysteine nucleosidase